VAARNGACVEGPVDRDGSCFSLHLNSVWRTITADLMERPVSLATFRPSQDPSLKD
jgi:hypothetical protein